MNTNLNDFTKSTKTNLVGKNQGVVMMTCLVPKISGVFCMLGNFYHTESQIKSNKDFIISFYVAQYFVSVK